VIFRCSAREKISRKNKSRPKAALDALEALADGQALSP
jgi:hypothetical protein